jgi:hypothetical protein
MRDTCIPSPHLIGVFRANRDYLHLENCDLQHVVLSNLTQYSQGKNVLHAPATNVGGFVWNDTCIFSTPLNRPVLSKQSVSP